MDQTKLHMRLPISD